jgi:hypothetical protein
VHTCAMIAGADEVIEVRLFDILRAVTGRLNLIPTPYTDITSLSFTFCLIESKALVSVGILVLFFLRHEQTS